MRYETAFDDEISLKGIRIYDWCAIYLGRMIPHGATNFSFWLCQRADLPSIFFDSQGDSRLDLKLCGVLWVTDRTVAKVSLDRVNNFLNRVRNMLWEAQGGTLKQRFRQNELLDVFLDIRRETTPGSADVIGFKNATFQWTSTSLEEFSENFSPFKLIVEGPLIFRKGELNLITGSTGKCCAPSTHLTRNFEMTSN